MASCKFDFPISARSPRITEIEATHPDRPALGMARLVFDEFGALNNHTITTNAMPYKVVVTAMVMERASREGSPIAPIDTATFFKRYGWIMPERVENWPGASPRFDKPIGMVSGEFRNAVARVRLEVSNIGCAACHSAMTYDAEGNPTGRVWAGAGNSSRNFDDYLNDILAALRLAAKHPDEFLATIPKVFPDVHPDEMRTIAKNVFPEIRKQLAEAGPVETLLPFSNGGPGLTNGVAALKYQLDRKGRLLERDETGYVSIPDLHGRQLRSSYLADGVYAADPARRFEPRSLAAPPSAKATSAAASVVAFFLVPTAGIKTTASEAQTKRVEDVLAFVATYRPPKFPGAIDRQRATRGAALFAAKCEGCHGRYEADAAGMRVTAFPNRLVPQAEMGSDPRRWEVVTDSAIAGLNKLPVAKKLNGARSGGYVAPILSGVWMTAPYLHNGSVPTLWHLMRPETRPAKFMVGGHKLDYQRVGIAGEAAADGVFRYPGTYVPWAKAWVHDTAQGGKSNAGHEKEFTGLDDIDKDDLLEYLKTL